MLLLALFSRREMLLLALSATNGLSSSQRRRVCYHEAAHFLCGYVVGLPIKSYEASTSAPRVEFFDTSTGDAPGGPNSFDDEQVAQLAVVSMAGAGEKG